MVVLLSCPMLMKTILSYRQHQEGNNLVPWTPGSWREKKKKKQTTTQLAFCVSLAP